MDKLSENTCLWSLEDGVWRGVCGVQWCLNEGTPKDNEMNYCPECGKKIIEVEL